MRYMLSITIAFCLAVSVLAVRQGRSAEAAFHCTRIHAVVGGLNGNTNIQYVELRMDVGGQTLLTGHTLEFFNQSGQLRATFTFPTGITNGNVGDSVLLGTSEFSSSVTGGAADFTFSATNTSGANGGDPLHPVQAPGGSVVWAGPSAACVTVMAPVDSAAYGAATATYGTAAVALPSASSNQALRLSNLNQTPSNNSTEYSLQSVSTTTFSVASFNLSSDFTTPRNNGRTVLKLNPPAPAVGGVAEAPNALASHAVVASRSTGDEHWMQYAIAGGVAAAITLGAGLFAYRRRTVRERA